MAIDDFPETGNTCKDRDLALGDAQGNILQIVLAYASNLDVFLGHEFSPQFLSGIQFYQLLQNLHKLSFFRFDVFHIRKISHAPMVIVPF